MITDWNQEVANIVEWTKHHCSYAKIHKLVVGLSGGIDSALAAWIAREAVGVDNIKCFTMPCYSSPDSTRDGDCVAEWLGVESIYVPLSKTFDAWLETTGIERESLSAANAKARLRMTTLYGFAQIIGALVVGTSNRSELMTGYATKHGDGGVDFEPFGAYYKTEVRDMMVAIGAPQWVIDKTPTADLWEGQTDEAELGLTYEELDVILIAIENNDWKFLANNDTEMQDKIDRVKSLIERSEHKRNPAPFYSRWRT